jgi:hypothetical protein
MVHPWQQKHGVNYAALFNALGRSDLLYATPALERVQTPGKYERLLFLNNAGYCCSRSSNTPSRHSPKVKKGVGFRKTCWNAREHGRAKNNEPYSAPGDVAQTMLESGLLAEASRATAAAGP